MLLENELENGLLRLLEVDQRLVLPTNVNIRVLMTSSDVLHSFAIPSLGVKMDCVPGRLNQTSFLIQRIGIYYGQCSELCGVNHGFMPIVIEAVSAETYLSYCATKCDLQDYDKEFIKLYHEKAETTLLESGY